MNPDLTLNAAATNASVFPPAYGTGNYSTGTFNYRLFPPEDLEGGAGVREPRRPTPGASPAAVALVVPA